MKPISCPAATPRSRRVPMLLLEPVEIVYLFKLLHWEANAPPDGHAGTLDGKRERNTQITRLAFVLGLVGGGLEERVYPALARHTRRRDGNSYVSKNSAWMQQPYPLGGGWCFEGCTSLIQKQAIVQALTNTCVSARFVACADDFVAGRSVTKCFPTEMELAESLARARALEQAAAD